MSYPDRITYQLGTVAQLSSDVAASASQLEEIRGDIFNLTQALAEFFLGKGASTYFDAQQQALHGLDHKIQQILSHGGKIGDALETMVATDSTSATLFC
jgi:uncharacterized protein YukE